MTKVPVRVSWANTCHIDDPWPEKKSVTGSSSYLVRTLELCKLTGPEGHIQSGLSFSCFSFIEVV